MSAHDKQSARAPAVMSARATAARSRPEAMVRVSGDDADGRQRAGWVVRAHLSAVPMMSPDGGPSAEKARRRSAPRGRLAWQLELQGRLDWLSVTGPCGLTVSHRAVWTGSRVTGPSGLAVGHRAVWIGSQSQGRLEWQSVTGPSGLAVRVTGPSELTVSHMTVWIGSHSQGRLDWQLVTGPSQLPDGGCVSKRHDPYFY